ncbi:MAG: RHS repeat-associated core domain-containing protein [Clostridia bacterium]|nr:RHS repeat-associated core domain-containing protein [Clostridia bacterium]
MISTGADSYYYNGNNLEKRETPWVNGVQKSEIVKLSNTYDNFNQLVQSVTNTGVKVVNKYNGEGYRVEKTIVNGATTKYLYEGNKVVGEYDANGSQKAINVYGLNLLMRIDVFNDYYYMYNGHADVTALLSASGTVDAAYYFDAFGNVLNKTGSVKNSILYAGYQYDEETGLYYINARMYDPAIARFVQEDTYRGNPNDPLSLNLYAYCNNNPIKYIGTFTKKRNAIFNW